MRLPLRSCANDKTSGEACDPRLDDERGLMRWGPQARIGARWGGKNGIIMIF